MSPKIKSAIRTVVHGLVWIIPMILSTHPTWGDVTLSTAVSYMLHVLDEKFVA